MANHIRNVEHDFQQLTQQVPQSSLASALSTLFRSHEMPLFGEMVSQLFMQSEREQREFIVNYLLAAAKPLQGFSIAPNQIHQVSPETVRILADLAKKQDSSVADRASEFYAKYPTLVRGLGPSVLAFVMSQISQSWLLGQSDFF